MLWPSREAGGRSSAGGAPATKVDGFDPCSEPPEPKEAAAHLGRALTILGDLGNPPSQPIKDIEVITDKTRIISPVRVEQAWLYEDKVFIVGAGLNYDVHKNEVGGSNFVLFPKL